MTPTPSELFARYYQLAAADGGLPYRPGTHSHSEPTIYLCLAAIANNEAPALLDKPVQWLTRLQQDTGAISHMAAAPGEGQWTTAPFALLMHLLNKTTAQERAINFLLQCKSLVLEANDAIDLDTRIVGWPWVQDNFGWVEPTSWALLALRAGGFEKHDRFLEGQKFLRNRCIPGGGWNYGNKIVYNNQLLPFWDTTALAVLALGETEDGFNKINIELLKNGLKEIEALYSLSWVCICLEKAGEDVTALRQKITAILQSMPIEDVNLAHAGLALIALAPRRVLTA